MLSSISYLVCHENGTGNYAFPHTYTACKLLTFLRAHAVFYVFTFLVTKKVKRFQMDGFHPQLNVHSLRVPSTCCETQILQHNMSHLDSRKKRVFVNGMEIQTTISIPNDLIDF